MRRMNAFHPCGAFPSDATPSPRSDLNHLEVFLAGATFGTGPVDGDVFPARARRNLFLGQTRFFVVDPAADQAHPASVFHTYAASSSPLDECMMVPVWRRHA
jgi:hypothetical protein